MVLLLISRGILFLIVYYLYGTGGFSTSDIISIFFMYLAPTSLLILIYILTGNEIDIKRKNVLDFVFFSIYTMATVYIAFLPTSGEITRTTMLIWLSCIECMIDVYICKRFFLDRK